MDAAALTARLTQFNFHVARFAHPSWHAQEHVNARSEPQLSEWLLQELGLQEAFDWEMSESQRRLWLMDTPSLLRLSEETALAMHRDWLVRIIDGTHVRALITKVESDALRFVVQDVAPGSFHYHAPIVSFDGKSELHSKLQAAGARTLVALLQPEWRAARGRALLNFDRAWRLEDVPSFAGEQSRRALDLIVGTLIPRRFPEWAWLF